MDLTYQQVLAEVFDENAKNTLVFQHEFEDDDIQEHTTHEYENKELEEPELFNKFQGDRGKPEHVIKSEAVDHRISSVKHSTRFRNNVINIDGKFRSLIITNEFSSTTSNSAFFAFRPARQYVNVSSIRITSFEFSNSFYTYSALRGNTNFWISDDLTIPKKYSVTIPDGNYETTDILSLAINTMLLRIVGTQKWSIQFMVNLGTFYFINSISSAPWSITFPSTTDNPTNNGLGYNLGFSQTYYTNFPNSTGLFFTTKTTVVTGTLDAIYGDSYPDLIQDTYVFLKLQDWNVIEHHTSTQNSFQAFMKIPLNTSKNTTIYDNNSTNTTTKEYIPQQPINVNLITIKMVDAWGHQLVLRNSTFSITLEIKEVLDSQTYEKLLELNE